MRRSVVRETEACKICGNTGDNRTHIARENVLGLRTEFHYLECAACGCLQLLSRPSDIARYYPPDYYSFGVPDISQSFAGRTKQFFRRIRNQTYAGKSSIVGRAIESWNPHPALRSFCELHPTLQSRILDVGSGSGGLLMDLHNLGFKNVLGIDPFIVEDICYVNGVRILKRSLSDLVGTNWDVIMFHHSFEHVPDPLDTLRCAAKVLSNRGQCLLRIPVVSWAWEKYGVNWVQLDAPRHFFLHTEKSLGLLAQQVGLTVQRIEYDSDEFQFWGSELVIRNIPIGSVNQHNLRRFFHSREFRQFREQSMELNRQHRGDQAIFYLSRADC